jgi:voltage-gated potassium channel
LEFSEGSHSAGFFLWSERFVATAFTIEYFTRWIASRSWTYPFRVTALIDSAAILPFYIGFAVDLRSLRMVRALRILRLLKLYRYTSAMENITNAFHRIRYEFAIIGFAVLTFGWLSAVAIYELEHATQPAVFGKLSDAAWFVLTTITTVGYGDKTPITPGGRVATAVVMIGGLVLFGTFVSLIGGAFIEELRRKTHADSEAAESAKVFQVVGLTLENFDPQYVLQVIEARSTSSQGISHDESVRLLAVACKRLLAESKPRNNGELSNR